jgi:hypothetical protein
MYFDFNFDLPRSWLIGGVHIGAKTMLDISLILFGYIACLSQWEGGCSNDFYLPSRRLEEGRSAPCGRRIISTCATDFYLPSQLLEEGGGQQPVGGG